MKWIAVALAALLCVSQYVYQQSRRTATELEGEIRAARQQAQRFHQSLEEERQESRRLLAHATGVAEEERAARLALESRNEQLRAENRRLRGEIQAARQEHEVVVASIPTQTDQELAEQTAGLMVSAYPGRDSAFYIGADLTGSARFMTNRVGAETAQEAFSEVMLLRYVDERKNGVVANLEAAIGNLEERSASFERELGAERSVKEQLLNEVQTRESYEEHLKRQVDLLTDQAGELKRAAGWSTFRDWLVLGGVVTLGVVSGRSEGYAAAGGAAAYHVLRKFP